MPASIEMLQINDQIKKEHISQIIQSETRHLQNEYRVSIVNVKFEEHWELIIKPPYGQSVCRNLRNSMNDLAPDIFRQRFRELMQII